MNAVLVAGGTGGHIFPAIAFGEWLLREKKAASVSYVCGNRPLELEIYRACGISPFVLPIEGSPLGAPGFSKKIKRAFSLAKSFFHVKKIFTKNNSKCFLFGGYVSFPALAYCHFAKIPIIFHEQNQIMGKVARLAAKLGHTVVTGSVPTRPFEQIPAEQAMEKLSVPASLYHGKKIVGVLGGSLASGTLTEILSKVVETLPEVLFLVLADKPQNFVAENVVFIGRHWDMNPIFSCINLALCRAGASTLAELAAYKIPCVVIPWENAADDHQSANACAFTKSTGNDVWREHDDIANLISFIRSRCGDVRNYSRGSHDEASESLYSGGKSK